jgi:hypothetical protein
VLCGTLQEAHVAACSRLLAGQPGGRYLLNQSPLWHQATFAEALLAAAPEAPVLAHEAVDVLGYRAVPPSADVAPARDDLGVVLSEPADVVKATVATLREKARL